MYGIMLHMFCVFISVLVYMCIYVHLYVSRVLCGRAHVSCMCAYTCTCMYVCAHSRMYVRLFEVLIGLLLCITVISIVCFSDTRPPA